MTNLDSVGPILLAMNQSQGTEKEVKVGGCEEDYH